MSDTHHWADDVYKIFLEQGIQQVSFVPDSGLIRLINLCEADSTMHAISLTTEEEGIALSAGAYLGGQKAALLMQSSGVGNCINMLSLPHICHMPFFTLITMRGEWGEFNPWQVPMGQNVPDVLKLSHVIVYRPETLDDIAPTVEAALLLAFQSQVSVAVLVSQKLLGTKKFIGEK